MTEGILGEPAQLAECPGRTWFDALVEGWHDQGMMRQHMEGLHALDIAALEQENAALALTQGLPQVEVSIDTATGPLRMLADPATKTVAFTLPRPPALATDETQVIPGVVDEPLWPGDWQ